MKCHVTDHTVSQSNKMAGRKCPAAWALECSHSTVKRLHVKSPFKKWLRAELRSTRPDVDFPEVRHEQTGPGPCGYWVAFSRKFD